MCSCDQLRKLVAQVRPVGRMSLEPWLCFIFTADDYSISLICSETRFCKHVFTEAGVFLQNKSFTAISVKIKSLKVQYELLTASGLNAVQIQNISFKCRNWKRSIVISQM